MSCLRKYLVFIFCFNCTTTCNAQSLAFKCDKKSKSLFITGDVVNFSDFTDKSEGLDKGRCSTDTLQSVSIFATSKVIIDRNLKELTSNTFKLTVFAPTWEIVGTRTINLSGKDIPQSTEVEERRDKEEAAVSAAGRDGKGGVQGNQGGNFVGIGDKFINEHGLTIKVNGGPGTNGTDGERGGPGLNGTYANKTTADLTCGAVPSCHHGFFPIPAVHEVVVKDSTDKLAPFKCEILDAKWTVFCDFLLLGKDGKPSGNGGNGGKGGLGGYKGNIFIIYLGERDTIIKERSSGKPGNDGKGGKAGHIGSHGQNTNIYVENHALAGQSRKRKYRPGKPMTNGKDGQDGIVVTRKKLREEIVLNMNDITSDIVKYKEQLIENLNLSDTEDFRVKFYFKLEKNPNVLSMYETLNLVNELRSLEKLFHNNQGRMNFLQLYQSLSNRTAEHALKPNVQSSLEEKKVLTYLYTTILNREYNLKDRSDTSLVVDIYKYLTNVLDSIAKHNELKKATSIKEYSKDYNDNINSKTEEASKLINDVLLPEINRAIEENKDNVNKLLKEINSIEDMQNEQEEELRKQRIKLQGTLVASFVCDSFSLVADVLAFVPGVGKAASVAIKGVNNFARSGLGLDKIHKPPDTNAFLANAGNVAISFGRIVNKAKKKFNKLANLSLGALEKLKTPKKYLGKLKNIINKGKNSTTAAAFANFTKQIGDYFNETLDEIKKEIKSPIEAKDYTSVLSFLHSATQSEFALNLFEGLFPTFSANKKLIEEYNKAIEAKREELEQLKAYEESIRNEVGPELESMGGDVLNTVDELKGKSQASLDVSQWQIQAQLKDMNRKMQKMTQGLSSSELFTITFSKVQDAINTLIKLFDRIQGYQDQQNLAKYIADINSAGASRITVSDPKLNDAINYLELVISCNTVIQMYTTIMDAFKQFVFPLAKKYLNDLVLPSYLEYGESLEELVEKARTQLYSIKGKLDEYRSTATRYDAWMGKAEFNSRHTSTKPFYVWDYNTYSGPILKLLSGEEVTLFSDVKKSSPRYDAIKCTKVEINFKAKNKKTQQIINNVLDEFEISYTHMGNSYFRTKGRYFMLSSNSLMFSHSLEKNRRGEPITSNNVREKIEKGDAMLSPYTSWVLRLSHISEMESEQFKILQHYKKDIVVELVGVGNYINRRGIMKENIEVEKFYTPINS